MTYYIHMVNINLNNLKGENKMINHEVKLEEVAKLVKGLSVEDMQRLERILDHELAVAHHQRWALENVLRKGAA